jgi:hypothetical protein
MLFSEFEIGCPLRIRTIGILQSATVAIREPFSAILWEEEREWSIDRRQRSLPRHHDATLVARSSFVRELNDIDQITEAISEKEWSDCSHIGEEMGHFLC